MMTINYILTLSVLLITIISEIGNVNGHSHPAYNHDEDGLGSNNLDWQSRLDDDIRITQISIPGTHDTMSIEKGGDIVITQSATLDDQLDAGIRALDIRCRAIDGVFTIHHGSVYTGYNFGEVLTICSEFLDDHPTEFILMRVKQEYSNVDDEDFTEIMATEYFDNKNYESYFHRPKYNDYIPTVGEVRGKIIILENFGSPKRIFGIKYPKNANVQDEYSLDTNFRLYSDKWLPVKDQLKDANANFEEGLVKFYVNYLSASGGSFPYFVASGHSNPATGAPRLATGLVDGISAGSDYWPDFPRVDCFLGACTIAFEGTNILTYNYIEENKNIKYVGIIMADFPGQGLIDAVIGLNFALKLDNDGPWGEWGEIAWCPWDQYLNGFKIQVETKQGSGDDTAANSLILICTKKETGIKQTKIEPNNAGKYGDWVTTLCPTNSYIVGFNQLVEPQQGSGDDTALNTIWVKCSSGDIEKPSEPSWAQWGEWGEWAFDDDNDKFKECVSDNVVCGAQLKIESDQGGDDDTFLNAVRFMCCDNKEDTTRIPTPEPTPRIPEYDEIKSFGGKCLDVHVDDVNKDGGKVQSWDCNGWDNQQWMYTLDKEIKSKGGKCLDVHSDDYIAKTDGAEVQIWNCNGQDNQKWELEDYQIISFNGKCLDIDLPNFQSNGGYVQLWNCAKSANQLWLFD